MRKVPPGFRVRDGDDIPAAAYVLGPANRGAVLFTGGQLVVHEYQIVRFVAAGVEFARAWLCTVFSIVLTQPVEFYPKSVFDHEKHWTGRRA